MVFRKTSDDIEDHDYKHVSEKPSDDSNQDEWLANLRVNLL